MHATKPLKLEIARTTKPAGTMTRKRNDADNSIMAVAVVTTIISSAKKLVLADANENNYRQHRRHRRQQKVNWNHSGKSIAYCNPTADHAEQFNQDTSMTVAPVFAMFSPTEDVEAIRTTSSRLRIAKIAVEMYRICAVCHQFMVVAKRM